MAKENMQSKAHEAAPATATIEPPAQPLVVIGKIRGQEIAVPNLSSETVSAREMVGTCRAMVNCVDSEDTKLYVNSKLVQLKQRQAFLKAQLAKITNPLVNARREALQAKQAAENLFAPALAELEVGEKILKGEILRYTNLVERQRLEAEAELRRRAEAESARLQAVAREESERIARENMQRQQAVAQLELDGQNAQADVLRQQAAVELEVAAESVQRTLEDADSVVHNAIVPSTSVKMKGTSITGKWVSDVVDPFEVLAGIVERTTSLDALRVRVDGRLIAVNNLVKGEKIEGIEINLPYFSECARKEEQNFSYRGMKARFDQTLRVTA